ncbi:MAG: alpha-E domain-containing protein [Chloroflexota bacterium]
MLARHAEDLLWIGRYLERAEDTARLLDVTYHTTLEAADDEVSSGAWRDLAETLYLEDETKDMDRATLARFLVTDPTNGGSIVAAVGRARENARGVREWLTLELWEEINAFHLELAGMDLARALEQRPYALCELVRRRCETIIGVATAAMPRTEGYQFLLLGQLLERAGITARLLWVWQRRLAGIGASAGFLEWTKVLRSVSAYEAYLREHHATFDGLRVLSFLLASRELPRSVLYCLEVAERQLVSLSSGPYGRASLRAIGRVRSDVEFAEPTQLSGPSLASFLAELEGRIQGLGRVIEDDFFRHADFGLYAYETF